MSSFSFLYISSSLHLLLLCWLLPGSTAQRGKEWEEKLSECGVACRLIFLSPNLSSLILRNKKNKHSLPHFWFFLEISPDISRRAFVFFWLQVQRIELITLPSSGHTFWLFPVYSPNSSPIPHSYYYQISIHLCLLGEANHCRLHYLSSLAALFLLSFDQWEALAGGWRWGGRGWGICAVSGNGCLPPQYSTFQTLPWFQPCCMHA